MPTLSRCIGTKVSRVRASSDRVGRPLGWTGLIITPLQRKPGPALLFRQPTSGSASSARPRDPKNPPPYPSEIVTFLSYTHKLHLYTPFWEFFNNMWEALNKVPPDVVTGAQPTTPPVPAHDGIDERGLWGVDARTSSSTSARAAAHGGYCPATSPLGRPSTTGSGDGALTERGSA